MYHLAEIIPQSPPMRLIDSLDYINEEQAICTAKITANHVFYDYQIQGIYAWVGIEMMAQASAALAYFEGSESDHTPRRGFMISVRNFKTKQSVFAKGEMLTIIANKEMIIDPIGVFLCQIQLHGKCIATAKFSAYQPSAKEFEQIVKGKTF
ncbi:hypothetical protein [Fastidiosibacter lacustris]|uniref:ApeP family dehydratase n=1 Tax=Fastidiosibacter lacustris TaxID=2056695 RepID=UPI000E34BCE8|nr:hypothetical protein [Fastidiosibacter lacustris]